MFCRETESSYELDEGIREGAMPFNYIVDRFDLDPAGKRSNDRVDGM